MNTDVIIIEEGVYMLEKYVDELAQSYDLKEKENEEFSSFKVSGMNFDVKAYEALFLGNVSLMKAKMPLGLMEMETLIINPFELDAPLLSIDLIKAMGKITLFVEQYDTLVQGDRKEQAFLAIKKKYEDLNEDTIKPNWYDELRYSASLKKKVSKKEAARIETLADEYFETYLDVCRDARVCDYDEKKAKADIYRDGLLNNGGPATDTFLKAWGREKSEKFFKEVLFG